MSNNTAVIERRKKKRYPLCDGVTVQFQQQRLFNLITPKLVKSEPAMDMSTGGVAFEYKSRALYNFDGCELTIRGPDGRESLEFIQFKIVSDIPLNGHNGNGAQPMRRCGLKFFPITPRLASRIDRFLQKHVQNGITPSHCIKPPEEWYYVDLTT